MKPAPLTILPLPVSRKRVPFLRVMVKTPRFWPEDKVCTSACPTPGATRSTDRQ